MTIKLNNTHKTLNTMLRTVNSIKVSYHFTILEVFLPLILSIALNFFSLLVPINKILNVRYFKVIFMTPKI